MPKSTVQLAQGDKSGPKELQVTRKISPGASIELDVCYAQLTIKASKDESLHVGVSYDGATSKTLPADALREFGVTPQAVRLQLYLPKQPLAKVFIEIPTTTTALTANLVHGDMAFETEGIEGERTINIVFGHLDFLGNTDSYRNLQVSELMGSFHDLRENDHAGHGIVSKSLSGTGKGSVNISVVKGTINLKGWD